MENFEEIIGKCPVVLGMRGSDMAEIAACLVDALLGSGRIAPALRDDAVRVVLERESLGSTAISSGIAIPHGYLEGVEGTAVAIGVEPDGAECGAPDGAPSRIFVLMLNSSKAAAGHIKFLVSLNQRLLQAPVREAILAARTRDEVVAALCGWHG